MTVKSLLQIILFLLIIIIVGGIYFLYFYSGTQNHGTIKVDNNSKISQENMTLNQNNIDKDNQLIKIEENKNLKLNEESISDKPKENKDKLKKNKEINNSQYVQNLTKEIEYITSTKNGDIIKIFAKSGKTNLKNNNILDLEDVNGTISSDGKSNVYISSKFAEYNYSDQNSKFYEDVEIKYIDRIIICDNFDLKINDNIAVAYNNVIIEDNRSSMKAQRITMDMITKDIKINSKDNIEVTTN